MNRLWITWEKQRRNEGISYELGFSLQEIISKEEGVKRYFECAAKTINLIRNSKPTHVIVQNPSIILALLGILLKKIYGFNLLVDAHNAGIIPFGGKSKFLNFVAKYIQKSVDCTIVTNNDLKHIVEENGGAVCVLPDKIPRPNSNTFGIDRAGKSSIFYICTYAKDEPYFEVIKAAEFIPEDIIIAITGNYTGIISHNNLPRNVKLLGYLSEEDYWATMMASDIVMDLTTRDSCLVCGAYEGVALEKPLIISNTAVSRNYFYKGCVYVDSDAHSIANGIVEAFESLTSLQEEVSGLKNALEEQWEKYADNLRHKL